MCHYLCACFVPLSPSRRYNPGAFIARGQYEWRGIGLPQQSPPGDTGDTTGDTSGTESPEAARVGSTVLVLEDRRPSMLQKEPSVAQAQASALAAALATSARSTVRCTSSGLDPEAALAAVEMASFGDRVASLGDGAASLGDRGVSLVTPPLRRASVATANTEVVILEEEDIGYPLAWMISDALSLAVIAVAVGVCSWYLRIRTPRTDTPFGNGSHAVAVLIGPIGCLLRYTLSRYNGAVQQWKWFPAGTFAANMLGCTVNFLIRGATTRFGPVNFTVEAVLSGIMLGFSGSLTTVSTWVVEVGVKVALWGWRAQCVCGFAAG